MQSQREVLIDRVIEQIEADFVQGDTTALYELLSKLFDCDLEAYLPEGAYEKETQE